MWLYGRKQVEVETEVRAPSPLPSRYRLERRRGQPPDLSHFRVSPLTLYVALARTVSLTSHPLELVLNASSAFLHFGMRLDEHNDGIRLRRCLNLKDAERFAWAARIGDALGVLYMERKGFPWFAHFQNVDVAEPPPTHSTPDFVAANSGEAVLLECKGTTITNEQRFWHSKVTDGYRTQIDPWLGSRLEGALVMNRGYVVGSMVNALQDAKTFCIGTDNENVRGRGDLLPKPVLQVHYARWFQLMGLWPQAFALRARTSDQEQIRFVRKRIGLVRFLFPDALHFPFRYIMEPPLHVFLHPLQPVLTWEGRPLFLGLEERVAHSVFAWIRPESSSEQWFPGELPSYSDAFDFLDAEMPDQFAVFRDGAIAATYDAFMQQETEGEPIYL